MSLKSLVSARLEKEILANKDEVDKDEAVNYMIAGLVTLTLHLCSNKCFIYSDSVDIYHFCLKKADANTRKDSLV